MLAGRMFWKLSSVSGTGSVTLAGRSSGSVMTRVLRVHGVCPCGSVAQWSGHRFWRPRPPLFLCQVRGWMGRPGRASQHLQSRHEAFTPQASPSPGSARPSSRLWACRHDPGPSPAPTGLAFVAADRREQEVEVTLETISESELCRDNLNQADVGGDGPGGLGGDSGSSEGTLDLGPGEGEGTDGGRGQGQRQVVGGGSQQESGT